MGNDDFVRVPRAKLQYVRDLLIEKVYGSHARSPSHNARLEVDDMLAAPPSAPSGDNVSTPSELEGSSPALRAQEQNEAMRRFCRYVVREYCWGYTSEPDGGDIQDVAEKLGIIVPSIATAADAEHMESTDVGDTIFRFADWLDEPRGLSASEQSSNCEAVTPISPDPTTGGKG